MSDLTSIEKRMLERALEMGGGYVLNFSTRTFSEFFVDCLGIDIYHDKYSLGSGSKANRMRAFWDHDNNYLVGKALGLLIEGWSEFKTYNSPEQPPEELVKIAQKLKECAPIADIDVLKPNVEDESFESLSRSIRESIDQNEPETGLDRLHTYLVKYFRALCVKRSIEIDREKPLHSLVGEYIKALKTGKFIESDTTELILKSSISILEAFNRVRNDQSFAHDNKVLNYNESLLIFGYVTASIRFIKAIEMSAAEKAKAESIENDILPF